jgi:hypothetical protein
MYKGNMQDYVNHVTRRTGLDIKLAKDVKEGYVLHFSRTTETCFTMYAEYGVRDSEDFEEQVEQFAARIKEGLND